MPCYARACRRVRPCPSQPECERVWHACDTSAFRTGLRTACPVCHTIWTRDGDTDWHRQALQAKPEDKVTDRTVHAETSTAEVVRYYAAGIWYIEDKTGKSRVRMRLRDVVEWVTEQPQGDVTYHLGRTGGRQFDSRVHAEFERVGRL